MDEHRGPEIHERIRARIDAAGYKHVAFARRMGVSKDWLSDRMTGRVKILAEELPEFAEALNVHPCAFFEERARSAGDPPYGQDLREQIAADVLDLARALSPARAAVLRRVLQGLDEAGVE
jgi:transcriptional regulator with XRE-family HTH domain